MPTQNNPQDHGTSGPSEIVLPPDGAIAGDNQNPRRRRAPADADQAEVGLLVEPQPHHDLDELVLHPEVKTEISAGLRSLQLRPELERVWNLGRIQAQEGRCILNFYGDPGTGKTRAALGVALRLGKPLYQVDYSAIISKYLGDTAKHLVQAFKRARALDAVLFFDEADSLLSKRIDMDHACATSINQNRNTLMQELDRFNGVVIVTTNLFKNYDPALLRRIQRHIKFKLPDKAMRARLLKLHLPNRERVQADLDFIAGECKGFSGGDILNVCVNAIYAGSTSDNPEEWAVANAHLVAEVEKVKTAKREHGTSAAPANN